MKNRFRRIFTQWGWLALMIVFMILVFFFARSNQRHFRESIVENFNSQQTVLVSALSAIVSDHTNEAVANLKQINEHVIMTGNLLNTREILSAVYAVHEDDFIALCIYDSSGKRIAQVPMADGQSSSISIIQLAIRQYSGETDQTFITQRFLFDHQSTVGIIHSSVLPGGERFYSVGLLKIEEFLQLHLTKWNIEDLCFILAKQNGDILSMLNVQHDDNEFMSEGNIRNLGESCLSCHKPEDFVDIIQSFDTGKNIISPFYYPDGRFSYRSTTILPIFNDVWSWSVCTPYDTIQGAIDENFLNLLVYSAGAILMLGILSFFGFRSHNKRVLIEGEAENLRLLAKTSSALVKSEDRFQTLFQESVDAIFFTNRAGECIDINQSWLDLFGYTRKEMLSINVIEIYLNSNDRKAFQHAIEIRGYVKEYTVDMRHKDGTTIHCLLNASVTHDEEGDIIGYQGFIHDITRRLESEKVLQQSIEQDRNRLIEIQESFDRLHDSQTATMNLMEDLTQEIDERKVTEIQLRKLSLSVEQSPVSVVITDIDGIIEYVNPKFEEITGYLYKESVGNNPRLLNSGVQSKEFYTELWQTITSGKDWSGEFCNKKKSGELYWEAASISSIKDDEGVITHFVAVKEDITRRRKTEQEREQALQEARQANKVKDLFMANMSHEIRTPLNSIMGFSDLIERNTRGLVGDEEKEFFDVIKLSGNRLMHTVHEILDISQIEAGTYILIPEPFDLCDTVKGLVKEFKLMVEKKNLTLEFYTDLDSAVIQADQYGVTQAINNIIDNAIKYTDKGKVIIKLKQVSKNYVLSIQDTGVGIAEEYLKNMYNAFSQESEGYTKKFQGIGLGMAITKRHLDLNKVDINVESAKDEGTTFTLIFKPVEKPLSEKKNQKKAVSVVPDKELVDKPLVMVVEDDPNAQKLAEYHLKEQYELFFADSVDDAKQQLKKHSIELVLLDLSLIGDEDGLDLVRWMRKTKKWKGTPVIATTAHVFTSDQDNCIAAGCNDFIGKPMNMNTLLGMMSQYGV